MERTRLVIISCRFHSRSLIVRCQGHYFRLSEILLALVCLIVYDIHNGSHRSSLLKPVEDESQRLAHYKMEKSIVHHCKHRRVLKIGIKNRLKGKHNQQPGSSPGYGLMKTAILIIRGRKYRAKYMRLFDISGIQRKYRVWFIYDENGYIGEFSSLEQAEKRILASDL